MVGVMVMFYSWEEEGEATETAPEREKNEEK